MMFDQLNALIIDDDDFSIDTIRASLNDINITNVTTANSGERALAALSANQAPYDVILCDLHMPEMDGEEVISKIAERKYEGGVILYSGLGDTNLQEIHTRIRAFDLNILQCLQKPVTTDDLISVLSYFSANAQPIENLQHANIRVNILDDDPMTLDILTHQLHEFGVSTIVTASNVKDLKVALNENARKDDLLLIDIFMPDEDGVQLLMDLGKANYVGNIALMSGRDPDFLDRITSLGQHLGLSILRAQTKPQSLADIRSLLTQHLKSLE